MTARILGAAIVAGMTLMSAGAWAATVNYTATLDGKSEVPPNDTNGTGHLSATYDTLTKAFDWKVDYQGLTGPATAAHFHAPAPKGKNADVAIPVTGSLASPMQGKTTLTDAQAKALDSGEMYFNIHTAAHKPGEIRGWLEKGM